MKKILYMIAAVLAVAQLSSCSNDDIEFIDETTVVSTKTVTDLSVNVPTQDLYDQFGITQSVKEQLGTNKYSVAVSFFLYGSDGALVNSVSKTTATFVTVSNSYEKLDAGTYTLVVVETITSSSDSSKKWAFSGINTLNTLEIVEQNTATNLDYYNVVGMYSSKVVIGNEAVTVDATPKGIGALVDLYFYKMRYSVYDKVCFGTEDKPQGRLLSPNISGNDRFDYDKYTTSGYFKTRKVEYVENITDNQPLYAYLIEEGDVISYMGVTNNSTDGYYLAKVSDTAFNYKDGNRYYATLAYTGSGFASAIFSKQEDVSTWYKNLSFNFKKDAEPYLTWGASESQVKAYMTENGMAFIGNETSSDGNNRYSVFNNPQETLEYTYWFDTNNKNLEEVDMEYDASAYSRNDVKAAIAGSYTFVGRYDSYSCDLYKNSTTAVYIFDTKDGKFTVVYGPSSSSDNSGQVADAEPYLTWGASGSTVKSYMEGKGMTYVGNGTSSDGSSAFSQFSNPDETLTYAYWFDLNFQSLQQSDLYYDSSSYDYNTIKTNLDNKYTYYGRDDSSKYHYYLSSTSIVALFDEANGMIRVVFLPNTTGSSAPALLRRTKALPSFGSANFNA